MTGRTIFFLTVFLFETVVQTCMAQSAAEKTKEQLEAAGVRISSTTAFLSAETELSRSLRDVIKVRRALVSAEKKYEDFQKAIRTLDGQITLMNRQLTQLNTQLANVSDVATNNRLVGAINAMEGKLRLTYQRQEALSKQENDVHAQVSKARDELITHVSEMSQLANELKRGYDNSSGPIASLLRKYNILAKADIKLEPTRAFQSNLRKVDQFDLAILSEDVPLRRDGNTYYAGVTINDETIDMVVDSGASIVLLPYEAALKLGVKPGKNDQEIRMVVADGRVINGYKMTIPSMRVGQFTAEKVECAVLGSAATNAEPLLGMSFLGKFKFEINAGDSALRMTHIGEKPKGASGDGTSAILTKRTVFPGELRQLKQTLCPDVQPKGAFEVKDGRFVTHPKSVIALQASDIVNDFELDFDIEFHYRTSLHILIGWDIESSSGWLLAYDHMTNKGNWSIFEFRNGLRFAPPKTLTNVLLDAGKLQVSVKDSHLTIRSQRKSILSDHFLERYSPGSVIFCPRTAYNGRDKIVIKELSIAEEPAEKLTVPITEPVSSELYANVETQQLFPGNGVTGLAPLPIAYYWKGKPKIPDAVMKIDPNVITSEDKKWNIIELDENAENFELKVVGNFEALGYLDFTLGWDQEKVTGYRVFHEQLPKNGVWQISDVKEDRSIGGIPNLGSVRLGKDCTIIVRVFDKVLTIEVNEQVVVPHFLLIDYKPGEIRLETNASKHGGRPVEIQSISIRKL